METNTHIPYQRSYRIGILFSVISMAFYLLGDHGNQHSFTSGMFFISYGLSIAYLVILLFNKISISRPRPGISYACWINALILFTISAFSLNKDMHVFAKFPLWLNIYTLLSIPLFLVFPFFQNLPSFVRGLVLLLSGASLTLSLYMTVYILPLLPFSIIGLIALGISVHSFIPAFWLLTLFDFIFRRTEKTRQSWLILPGALVPLIFLGIYLHKWHGLQSNIKEIVAGQNIQLSHQLPQAIYLAQKLPADPLTDEILASAYKAQRIWSDGLFFSQEGRNKYHNPLATVALGMFGDIGLDVATTESILNIRKDCRHATTEKLWTGISLSTSAVSTNIQVFPGYRLAYHEKTLVIHNDPSQESEDFWFARQTQEALYTFHVPEGSIVTSLSLWINGREEKSRLCTVQKADSAYKQIVGVQRRDPALVHWKEGNCITVNVFPCTPAEDRKFRIGFTTPLKVADGQLCLENIWFEGPDSRRAQEATQILLQGSGAAVTEWPGNFEPQASGNYLYTGKYQPYWQMKLGMQPLSQDVFCFGGAQYALREASAKTVKADLKQVFLDITKEWTEEEYASVISRLGSKQLYTWLPAKTLITSANKELVWKEARRNQFSVPFVYDIADPEQAVIITKTSHRSPILSDLKQSDLADKFTGYLSGSTHKLNVLNIGGELSPFWRSLRELRLIHYESCSTQEAIDKTLSGRLKRFEEDSSKTVIHSSRLAITKTITGDTLAKGSAPDHLLRIFAYNDLLRKIGPAFFEKEKYESDLFRQAEEAYVVSPVTSMIVLESTADYERMGIGRNTNTVGNAGIAEGGAVPEPHEWLLIALVVFFIGNHLLKQRRLKAHGDGRNAA